MDCARQGWPRGHGPECGWDGVGDGDGDGDGRWGRRQVGMGQRWGRVRNGDMDRHWGRGQMGTRGRDGDRKLDRVQRWGYKKKPEYRQGSGSRKEDGDEGLGSEHEGEKVGTRDKVGSWERQVTETGAETQSLSLHPDSSPSHSCYQCFSPCLSPSPSHSMHIFLSPSPSPTSPPSPSLPPSTLSFPSPSFPFPLHVLFPIPIPMPTSLPLLHPSLSVSNEQSVHGHH